MISMKVTATMFARSLLALFGTRNFFRMTKESPVMALEAISANNFAKGNASICADRTADYAV